MKVEELLRCQIQEWYPIFKPHTIKTLFHPLPESFIRYILGQRQSSDSDADPPPFFLPRSASGRDPLPRPSTCLLDPDSSLTVLDSDDSDDDQSCSPSFPELESAVQSSISALGGAAFPKLNWSSPKDAAWISPDSTLRCSSFADVALLLHSSDSIAHDLSHALPSCSDYDPNQTLTFSLALRKFYPALRPDREFRCFARRQTLVAISQREVTTFYPVLLDRKEDIRSLIERFFDEIVRPRFELEDCTFDVYLTEDGRVKVVDFNPWGGFTLPLMFTWEELESEEGFGEGVEFRVVESQCGVRPGLKTAVPYDYLDTGEGSGWDQFLRKADKELRRQVHKNPEEDSGV